MFLKKSETFLFLGNKKVSATNVSFARKERNIEGNMFPQQCFHNNVSSFAGAFRMKPVCTDSCET